MLSTILRVLMVCVIFLAGVLAGNIFMPQKNLEQKDIVSTNEPRSMLNLRDTNSAQNVLNKIDTLKGILTTCGQSPESIFDFENSLKRSILLSYYEAAKAKYSLELLKLQTQPQNTVNFLEARDVYQKIIALIEQTYPVQAPKEVLIIKDDAIKGGLPTDLAEGESPTREVSIKI